MKLADALAAGETRLVDRTNLKLGEVIEKYLSYQQLNDRAPKTMEKYEYSEEAAGAVVDPPRR
jgi:hypothetical protein